MLTRSFTRSLSRCTRASPIAATATTITTPTCNSHLSHIPSTYVRYQSSWEEPRYFDSPEEKAVNNLLYNFPSKPLGKTRRVLCALVANEPGVLSRISSVLAGRGFNIDSLVVSSTETEQLSRMTIVLKGGTDVEQAKRQLEDIVQVWAVVELNPDLVPVVERELLLVKLRINTVLPASIPPQHSVDATKGHSTPSPPVIDNKTSTRSAGPWMLPSTSHASTVDVMSAHIQRQAIVELTELFQGRVVDVATEQIMVELTGKSSRIDAFIELVRPFGITELARSGAVAMVRGRMKGFEVGEQDTRTLHATTTTSGGGSNKVLRKNTSNIDESKLPPG